MTPLHMAAAWFAAIVFNVTLVCCVCWCFRLAIRGGRPRPSLPATKTEMLFAPFGLAGVLTLIAVPILTVRGAGCVVATSPIVAVLPDSPAASAGFRAGDVIQVIDGQEFSGWNTFASAVSRPVSPLVSFRVLRGQGVEMLTAPRALFSDTEIFSAHGIIVATLRHPLGASAALGVIRRTLVAYGPWRTVNHSCRASSTERTFSTPCSS